MRNLFMRVVVAVLIAGPLQLAVSAQRSWVEVTSPHFTVVSDDGERAARAIAWQFEQIRSAMQVVWSWARVDTARPILVFALKDEASMKALAPRFWEQKDGVRPESVFVEGVDRYHIALRSDVKASDREGINPYMNAYWSYVALVLDSSFERDLPLWLQRGLAGVFSNTLVRDASIQFGRAIPWHLQRLQRDSRLTLRELVTVDRRSPWYTEADRNLTLDAACWGFVHFLMFADKGAHRPRLDRFLSLMQTATTPAAATEEAFGNLDALQSGFSKYYTRPAFEFMQVAVDARTKPEGFSVRAVAPAESASLRAAFHAAMRRPVEARAALDEARRADSRLPSTYDTEGMLLDADRRTDEARLAYAKAVELGSTNFYVYYRLAALMWRQGVEGEDAARLKSSLERAMALNDRYAAAHALLGEVNARLGRTSEAMAAAARAVALEPGAVYHRLARARVLWRLSRPDEAKSEAQKALSVARTENERADVQELIEFFQKNAPPAANQAVSAGDPAITPAADSATDRSGDRTAWPPPGVARAGEDVRLPRVTYEERPQYTSEAMKEKIQGSVLLECVVLPNGSVGDVQVVRSLDSKYGLDRQAIAAAKQWRFEPGTRDGKPVPVLVTIEMAFTLGLRR